MKAEEARVHPLKWGTHLQYSRTLFCIAATQAGKSGPKDVLVPVFAAVCKVEQQ